VRETKAMKTLRMVIAVAMLTSFAMPANAEGFQKGIDHSRDEKKPDIRQQKADERAYKSALEKIPDPKEKYDPWAVTKPAEPAKDAAKKPKQVSQ
jgi:hypothetical protein